MQIFSKGRLIAGCVIGAACGLLLPVLLAFSAWVLPIPILFAFLWVWAGWPAVLVGALSAAAAGYWFWFLGWGFSAALLLIALPGVLAAILTSRRKPFFQSVGISVAMQLAALILLTVIAWLIYRQNLVDVITATLKGFFYEFPGYLQHYLVLQLGQIGMFGDSTGIDFSKAILTDAQLQSLVDQIIHSINSGLKLSLPAYVLTSGAATGALSYLTAAWTRVRRGDDPAIPFVKPEDWRLKADLIIGPPALALVCLGFNQMGISGADAAYVALVNLAQLLFSVQAVGAIVRRLKAGGVTPGKRTALVVLALVIGQRLMPLVGIYSALFGSQGLISKQIRKRMDGKGDE